MLPHLFCLALATQSLFDLKEIRRSVVQVSVCRERTGPLLPRASSFNPTARQLAMSGSVGWP